MARRTRLGGALILGLSLWLLIQATSSACPFCTMQGQTLTSEVSNAHLVLYGKLVNANQEKDSTDIEIEMVIKDHAVREKANRMTLNRYVDLSLTGDKDRFLVFCDIFKGKIDPYRGMALKAGTKLPSYLRAALEVKDKPVAQKLRFFFDYLDNPDLEISNDAYKEFGNSDYKDFQAMAKDLPADRVVKWLTNPQTPSFRMGLYASMLGHCGKEKDAAVLKALLDDPERRAGSGVDGIMAGYTMLKPKEGWAYIRSVLGNPKEEFMFRYAALRAVRFLNDYRTDVIERKQLIDGVCLLLSQEDIADLAIEDLRKWQVWTVADKVLAVGKNEAYKQPIVKRAILRYSLQCQGNAAATAYVAERRKEDPRAVEEAEELLKLEAETPAKPSSASGK
jgi:hypothetical protein